MSSSTNYSWNRLSDAVSRIDFGKSKARGFLAPDLKGVQIAAYHTLMGGELEQVIGTFFPIYSNSQSTSLNLEGVEFEDSDISEYEALEKGKTYQKSIYLRIKLISKQIKGRDNVSEDRVFLGNFPELTKRSNYIINGIEKFIISQIVRAPGAYILPKSQIRLANFKKRAQEGTICELFPLRGTLILFNYNMDKEERYSIKVSVKNSAGDNVVQFPVSVFFKAFGFSEENLIDAFYDSDYIRNTLENENFNPRGLIMGDNTYIKWFRNIILNVKDFDKWLEEGQGTIYDRLNRLSYEYYQKHWEKTNDLIGRLEMAAADSKNSEEYAEVRALLEAEIDSSSKVLNAIAIEWASSYLVHEIGISYDIPSYRVTSFQELLWVYFLGGSHYEIGKAGRYKLDYKLTLSQRILDKVVAQDIKGKDGKVVFVKGTLMTRDRVFQFRDLASQGKLDIVRRINLDHPVGDFKAVEGEFSSVELEELLVYKTNSPSSPVIRLIGIPHSHDERVGLRFADFFAIVSYIANLKDKIGGYDDIDYLGNKRLKLVNELLAARIQVAMARIAKFSVERMNNMEARINYASLSESSQNLFSVKSVVNTKPFQIVVKEFFNSHQLTQFLDQQNPLSELTNKRKISAMGPGGIKREDPNLNIRDVHYSHYGKICPVETPEGMNIGLIMALASFAQIDKYGFLVTPYYRVIDGRVTDEVVWLSAIQEENYVMSESTVKRDKDNNLIGPITARYKDSVENVDPKSIDFVDIAGHQLVSVSTSLIPFLEHNDANRALMGANMQRQAVPLLRPYAPIVGTGTEYKIACDSGLSVLARGEGEVIYSDGNRVAVKYDDKSLGQDDVALYKFDRSNQNTCKNQHPMVRPGQRVVPGDVLANGPAMQNGELALGQNVLVAFSTWSGYNYEDAIILSSRLIEEDIYTSIHIKEYSIDCLRTKVGDEEITRQIPGASDHEKRYLDQNGIIMIGAEVKEGDILVGKTSPIANLEQSSEEKLLQAIFSEKVKTVKDTSLRVPSGGAGVVTKIMKLSIYNNDKLSDDVIESVKIFITQKRKIQVGDKMAGRHGNKGIVSKIAAMEDMPYLEDGTPVDIILNPLGVPSRMNIGQVLETHLGFAARRLALKQLMRFYFDRDMEFAGRAFGLDQDTVGRLFNVVGDYLGEKGIGSLDGALQMGNIDFSIILSRLGLREDDLNIKVSTPIFHGANSSDLTSIMADAGIDATHNNGKFTLYDGKTGEKFEKPITVGIIYMLKLDHMVDDKIYARSVGPYSKITQQPLGGKCQNGGQRFGEMEVWALEAYGAAYNLRELLTIKSDDIQSRQSIFSSVIKNQNLPNPNIPESFKILVKKLEGACLKVNVQYGEESKFISCNEFIEKQLSRDLERESFLSVPSADLND